MGRRDSNRDWHCERAPRDARVASGSLWNRYRMFLSRCNYRCVREQFMKRYFRAHILTDLYSTFVTEVVVILRTPPKSLSTDFWRPSVAFPPLALPPDNRLNILPPILFMRPKTRSFTGRSRSNPPVRNAWSCPTSTRLLIVRSDMTGMTGS